MRYVATVYNDVIIAKGINYTNYFDENEIELTEYQYNTIPIPCQLVDGEFIACDYPKIRVEAPIINEHYPFAVPMAWLTDILPNESFIFLEGQAISRIEYAELFKFWGTTFGEGDGSTTFNVPNLSGRTLVGVDASITELNAIGKTGGEREHILTVNEIPSHSHNYSLAKSGDSTQRGDEPGFAVRSIGYTDSETYTAGGGQAHNNMQPYFAVRYICRAKI